jgi:peptide/nickel transport system permease protein
MLWIVAGLAIAAPLFAPNDPTTPFANRSFAPPTRIHVHDDSGWHAPFIYRQVLLDRIMSRYAEDTTSRVPIRWLHDGRLMSVDAGEGPLLLTGADDLGFDVWSRLVHGARRSLGVTLLGVIGAIAIGALIGAVAGAVGGIADTVLMAVADFMLVLPAVYLVLVLRAVLPLSLRWTTIFVLMAGLFAAAGWPRVARGVRGIVATERTKDYAQAARALGAGTFRLMRHLLPAASGFIAVELVLLVPAMLVAEVTLSFLGFGFPPDVPSWGTMLQDLSKVQRIPTSPWLTAPAAMLFVVVLGLQFVAGSRAERSLLTTSR